MIVYFTCLCKSRVSWNGIQPDDPRPSAIILNPILFSVTIVAYENVYGYYSSSIVYQIKIEEP